MGRESSGHPFWKPWDQRDISKNIFLADINPMSFERPRSIRRKHNEIPSGLKHSKRFHCRFLIIIDVFKNFMRPYDIEDFVFKRELLGIAINCKWHFSNLLSVDIHTICTSAKLFEAFEKDACSASDVQHALTPKRNIWLNNCNSSP